MTNQISIKDLTNQADCRYYIARVLKSRGKYQKAFEYFEMAAKTYEELANNTSVSNKIPYLERQKECLESMLFDAHAHDRSLWIDLMLKIKAIKEDIDSTSS
jgi:hypothetical protein